MICRRTTMTKDETMTKDDEKHTCDNPIRCTVCLAERATKATTRRTAAKRGAAKRGKR